MQCPVGMCAVEIAVGRNHFRFEPKTELHSQSVNPFYQSGKSALQLVLVDVPVAKRAVIAVALAEPTVVQNQHFNTQSGSFLCKGVNLLFVKVEVGRFPVVDQNRAALGFPLAAHKMVGVQPVVGAAHVAEAMRRKHRDCLGRFKDFARSKMPAEAFGMNAHENAPAAVGVHFRRSEKVARVDQAEPADRAAFFGCGLLAKREEGVVGVRGRAAQTSDRLRTVHHGNAFKLPFPCPVAVKVNDVGIADVVKVHAKAERPLQLHRLCRGVPDRGAARDGGEVAEHRIEQRDFRAAHLVAAENFQRVGFLPGCVGGGLTRERGLSCINTMRNIGDVGIQCARVGAADGKRSPAAVGATKAGVLHRREVKAEEIRNGSLGVCMEGGVVRDGGKLLQIAVTDVCAVVEMYEVTEFGDAERIARIFCVQTEGFCLFVVKYRHRLILCLIKFWVQYHFNIFARKNQEEMPILSGLAFDRIRINNKNYCFYYWY